MPLEATDTESASSSRVLSAVLSDRAEDILQRWSELVLERVPVAQDLSEPLLRDHVPEMLRHLSSVLQRPGSGEPDGNQMEQLPTVHALERLQEGFDLRQVVTEYRLLRRAVLEVAEEKGVHCSSAESLRLHDAIDEAISVSVERFTEARSRTLRALDRISEIALAHEQLSLDTLLPKLLSVLLETTAAVDSAALLMPQGEGLLCVRAAVGAAQEGTLGRTIRMGEGLAGRAAAERTPLHSRHAEEDPGVLEGPIHKQGLKALYAAPLLLGDSLVAVAMMGSRSTYEFSEEDTVLFRAMASRATTIIVRSHLAERVRTQGALAEQSLAQVDALFEGAPAGIAFVDESLRYIRINTSLARLNGFPPEAHLGKRLTELRDSEETRLAERMLQHVFDTGESVRGLEFELPDPDSGGASRYYSADYFPVSVGTRRVGVGGFLFDITTERQAKAVARAAEARLEAILDHSPAAIYTKDEASRLLLVSSGSERALGRTRDELRGKSDAEVMPEEAARVIRQNDLEILRTGASMSVEEVVPSPEGPRTYLSVKFAMPRSPWYRDALGGISSDITEYKRLESELRDRERALQESQARLELLVAAGQLGTFEFCFADRTVELNEIARVYLGLSVRTERLEASMLVRAIHRQDLPRLEEAFRAITKGPGEYHPWDIDFRVDGQGGREMWLASRGRAYFDEEGRPTRLMGVLIDITEHKHEEEFRERFLGIVSHDLRNPLSTIRAGADFVQRSEELPPRFRKTVARISASAERMSRMIADLLDFTRGRLGTGIPVTRRPMNLRHLTRHVLEDLELAHPESTFTFESEGSFEGEWDSDRIAQVMSNLLENAVRYGVQDRPIRVRLEGRGDAVTFSVRNEGAPIPSDLLPVIFDAFRRAGDHDLHVSEGLGLGLFITRLIVVAHGGTVEATSSADDGTAFIVTLPRRASRAV